MQDPLDSYDAIVIGGGPAGATTALCLARLGKRVVVIEKSPFPRFHVGESFLPHGYELIQKLGLGEQLSQIPHVEKYGAEFGMGIGKESTRFTFDQSLYQENDRAFNIERAPFDKMLLDAAVSAGAELRVDTRVKRIVRVDEGDVCVDIGTGTLNGRILLDASGQGTVLGRHLGLRQTVPHHRKVAYFGHFEGVDRLPGREAGHPTVAMCDEGWFWMINIDERRTSIGLVLDADIAKTIDCPPSEMLRWGIERCPLVRERLHRASPPRTTHTIADYSYYCRPYAGPGYFQIGDAAFFLDPVFSSGVSLGMEAGTKAAALTEELLAGQDGTTTRTGRTPRRPDQIHREYTRFLEKSAAPFIHFVNLFYEHSFRELLLTGGAPFRIQQAAISVLGGYVFPRPRWSLRWRIWALTQFVRAQRLVPLTPRRERCSLRNTAPVPLRPVEPVRASA